MSILDDIQATAVDGKIDLGTILRKCKLPWFNHVAAVDSPVKNKIPKPFRVLGRSVEQPSPEYRIIIERIGESTEVENGTPCKTPYHPRAISLEQVISGLEMPGDQNPCDDAQHAFVLRPWRRHSTLWPFVVIHGTPLRRRSYCRPIALSDC